MKAAVLISLACAFAAAAGSNLEEGSFLVDTFSPKVYGALPQNWAAVEDLRGIMYFGNTEGLLEYDGVSWRRIRVSNGSTVRALAVDQNGTVWVGAQKEFGRLRPGPQGELVYASLTDAVPASDRDFSDVWSVFATPQGIYFASYERLFRWSPDGKFRVWRPRTRFGHAHFVNGTVYVVEIGAGLERVRGDRLEMVPGGERFAKEDVTAMAPLGTDLLAFTRDGMFHETPRGFEPLVTSASQTIKADGVYSCAALPDGRIAVATVRAGLVLLDANGGLERSFEKSDGLDGQTVTSIYPDREGGVWLTLNNGLAHFPLAVSRFDQSTGLKGDVYAVAREDGALYAGTYLGLYRLKTEAGRRPVFEPVAGAQASIMALLPSDTGLLVGGAGGVRRVTGDRAVVEYSGDVYDLCRSTRNPDFLYAVGRGGLARLRWNGRRWVEDREIPSGGLEFRAVGEDNDGAVWVATRSEMLRVDFASDTPRVVRYHEHAGVPAGFTNIYRVRGRLVFATPAGLRRFDGVRFVPDATFGPAFADGKRAVSVVREGRFGRVWISGDGYNGFLTPKPTGDYDWHPMPMLGTGIGEFYASAIDPDGIVWAAGSEGWLARYEPALAGPQQNVTVMLRGAQALGSQKALFGGAGPLPATLRLPYRENALRFEFAAPFYDGQNAIEYQVKLDGSDRAWSPWTKEARKDYTNLWEGRYTFRVRARLPYGAAGSEAEFHFGVLPPWYRTWWAFVLYAAAAATALWIFVQWRLALLAAKNRRLEAVVAERTVELRREHEALLAQEEKTEKLLLNILPAPVADELRATGAVAPVAFDEVTVCFTDFVGFTESSEKLPPGELVAALNEYFTAFDEIVGRYGLEKLKTIGDAYMFASGMPQPRRAHGVDAVLAAFEVLEAVRRIAREAGPVRWQVRIGLHSGAVVAGVVGVRKFAFDIWGDTVNFASRMESASAPNEVNLSAKTYESVRDFIECERRGLVRVLKEQREVEMYFARRVRPELIRSGAGAIPEAFVERYRRIFGEEPRAFPALEGFGVASRAV